jgi:hypothetical protein
VRSDALAQAAKTALFAAGTLWRGLEKIVRRRFSPIEKETLRTIFASPNFDRITGCASTPVRYSRP